MLLYGSAVFVSAALLFQVQLIVGKRILPWFGGTAAVWTTSMMVFQLLLLAGYAWVDLVVRRSSPRRQALLHATLLAASVALLPAVPSEAWRESGPADPAARVVVLLVLSTGLPFFLLSCTTPLLSSWYARRPGARPYRLYAISNAGSLTGLLSYPLVIEPRLGTTAQSWLWSAGYVLLAVLVGVAAVRVMRAGERGNRGQVALTPALRCQCNLSPVSARAVDRVLWLLLPLCSSALLLAVTAHLTQNVAPVPLLWVAALVVYLVTFILAFAHERSSYPRRIVLVAALAVLPVLACSTAVLGHPRLEIALYLGGLFAACYALHGELARRKPRAGSLTSYYLAVSTGGALGSAVLALGAPLVVPAAADLPVTLVVTFAVLVLLAVQTGDGQSSSRRRRRFAFAGAAALALALVVTWQVRSEAAEFRRQVRNFYGSLAIADEGTAGGRDAFRDLRHGAIDHGGQYVEPSRRREATGYYYPATGVGFALAARENGPPRRVGVVGLGAGTLATYARPGDWWTFFEINPRVTELARAEFSYLADARGRVEVRHGDGRLELEKDAGPPFDVLVLDAFSGDAVPVHLLTDEAFALYLRRLRPDGLLAVHVTNRHLDLARVVQNLAAAHGRPALLFDTRGRTEREYNARWVVVANDPRGFERPPSQGTGRLLPAAHDLRTWTDDYSNLLAVVR